MSDGLNICCHEIVIFVCEIDISRPEAAEDVFYKVQALVRSSMLDKNLTYVSCIQEI